MSNQPKASPPGNTRQRRAGMVYGTAVFGILAMFGMFFWSGQTRQFQITTVTAVATQANTTAKSLTAKPSPVALATVSPQPATPTAVPTDRPSATPTNTTTNTSTPPPTATNTPTTTPLPPTEPPLADDPPSTALAVPTREPWPTINPTLLRKPPGDVDLSQTHLWFSRPVDGNNVPSAPYRFGMTYDQRLSPHRAVDIANSTGTSVAAVGPGTVFYAGEDVETVFGPKPDFYGRVVVVEMDWSWNGRKIYTLYGHLDSIAVSAGQNVSPGDILGRVGSTGVALGSHLHFEIRQDYPNDYDSVRNPELWYQPFAGRGVLAGRVIDGNGYFLPGTRVNLECSDATPRYVETYWDQYTPPDDVLAENFVISDLPAGTCRVWTELSGEVVEQWVEVRPGELSVAVLQIRP